MQRVPFRLNNGRVIPLKPKMAERLAYCRKGEIVSDEPKAAAAVPSAVTEAEALGIDLADVAGSGKDGRILTRDVREYHTRMLQAG